MHLPHVLGGELQVRAQRAQAGRFERKKVAIVICGANITNEKLKELL